MSNSLSCKAIVDSLDKYIIGQEEAKRKVAIALRNRYRRSALPKEIREEINPKNIILKGPTGVGKTEIARRLAKLVSAPFVKVEATKYTEVGYVGRDVESMIRDLVDDAVRIVKKEQSEKIRDKAKENVNKVIKKQLYALKKAQKPENMETVDFQRDFENAFEAGIFEHDMVEIEVADRPKQIDIMASGGEINIGQIMGGIIGGNKHLKKMTVEDARNYLLEEECDKLLDHDTINKEAISRAEQDGIIFIDEIDKIATRKNNGQDVSREGVQRDILPIVEGSTVNTKYGVVKTDYILFIAAGAFQISSISDLIPELQGRFPIIVEMTSLDKGDFEKILTVPENAITKQYIDLLKVDNVNLEFDESAIDEIASIAERENEEKENLGARRLQSIMGNLLDDVSFDANGDKEINLRVDRSFVQNKLKCDLSSLDFTKYIL